MSRERDIQDAFAYWLREREIPFLRSRMDKRPTIRKGWPDFSIFWCGRVIFIETKTETGRLSEDQKECIGFLQRNGNRVEVCRSIAECCEATRNILCENGRATDATASFPEAIRERFAEVKAVVAAVPTRNDQVPPPPPASGKHEFIANVLGTQWVCFGDNVAGSDFKMVRRATATDLAAVRRLD